MPSFLPSRSLGSLTGLLVSEAITNGLRCMATPTILNDAPSATDWPAKLAAEMPMMAWPASTAASGDTPGPPGTSDTSRPWFA